MDRLVYTSLGAASSQEALRVQLANDMANLSTVGYKRGSAYSPEAAYLDGPGFPSRFQPVVQEIQDGVNLEPGSVSFTGNNLDIAMNGITVLGVQADDGTIAFTRRGDLQLTADGFLQTGDGHIVMGEGAALAPLPGYDVTLTPDGSVYGTDLATEGAQPELLGQLMLRDASTTVMNRREDGLFESRVDQGQGGDFATGPEPVSIAVGSLEGSNVNPIEAMVSLLDLYRSFETQLKIIKNAEDIDSGGTKMMSIR
ncbi:MAG: flagellar hook-basal body complex protein [Pseudohongiellaceae bacterium]